MRVLVTGGAGFIGSNLVDELVKTHHVTVVDNLSTGKRENINPKAEFLYGDISDRRFVAPLPVRDVVFHTAALARIQPSIKDPIPPHDANVNGTLNMLEYCRRGSKMIFSGSSSVFKGDKLPTDEHSTISPKNPYALQKWICEQYIHLYHRLYGLDCAILRYFNVYGERQLTEGSYATVLGIFLKAKSEGEPMQITGDGEQRRDFTYVGDVVAANIAAITWRGTFNIGRGKNYSVNEIADIIGGEKRYIPARPGEVRQTLCDNSKAKKYGWKPTTEVDQWLASLSRQGLTNTSKKP